MRCHPAATYESDKKEFAERPWTFMLLLLSAVLVYLLLYPYLGITHDARLYTLQALHHLHPELYQNDIFLRFGSQDDYTVFTPIYALLIAMMGVEPAAALLTALSHAAFLVGAMLLARSLVSRTSAAAALFLLVALPSHYGSLKIFSYIEGFVTPRMLAEAAALLGTAAWLRKQHVASIVLLAVGMLVHPIMGIAGPAFVLSFEAAAPKWRKVWFLAPAAFALALLAGIAGLVPPSWLMDQEWREIVVSRAEYLELINWSADDWGRVATVFSTLLAAAASLAPLLRRIALATVGSTTTLMLIALLGGDALSISLVVQAQPWRCLWFATVIAIILIVPLVHHYWRRGAMGRCFVLLLLSAWLCPSENLSLIFAPLALTATAVSRKPPLHTRRERLLLIGACVAFGVVLLDALAVAALSVRAGSLNASVSPVIDALRSAGAGGAAPLLLLAGLKWFTTRASADGVTIGAVAICTLVVAASIATAPLWVARRYDEKLKAAFAPWRAVIPPGSDVLWAADSTMGANGPVAAWLVLERPSYVSRIQATTALFSRPAALEIRKRTQAVLATLPETQLLSFGTSTQKSPAHASFTLACAANPVRYIVTTATFEDTLPIPAPGNVRNPFRDLKLYVCP